MIMEIRQQTRETIFSVADPWQFGIDSDQRIQAFWLMDPDPAIFFTDVQDATKN